GLQHPDLMQRPVQLTVSTPCATVLDVPVTSAGQFTLGLKVPEGQPVIHWTIRVSRTFQPSDFGAPDTRRLGAAVAAKFTGSGEEFREQEHQAVLEPCLL